MRWTDTIHHDYTPFYLAQTEASVGDSVRVRLRVPKSATVQQVWLVSLRSGERHSVSMKSITVAAQPDWTFFEADLELTARTVRYIFWLGTTDDSVQFCTKGATRVNPSFRDWFQFVCDQHRPNWLDERVFYQIFPDRFRNGDPSNDVTSGEYTYNGKPVIKKAWHELPTKAGNVFEHWGGDLEGIRQGLDYLEALGVNGLYLNPIFVSPSNHRYDTEDYLTVDPHVGGNDALRRLLDEAHARGFKVVLDGVFNHTGDRLNDFKRALENHPERELFTFLPNGKYEAFFGVPTLPKLDFASPMTYERFLTGQDSPVRHWLRFGADGWRLDVAHMMGARGIDADNLKVLRHLKEAARSENPEAWIFGERFWDAEAALQGANDALSHDGGGEDGVMNYHGFTLPITDWLSGETIFDRPVQLETAEVAAMIQERYRVLPPLAQQSQYNLIGSHDIPRPLTRMAEDKQKLRAAFALLLGFPGVPGIYYGDEIGLTGGNDPFCRAPFPWDETQWDKSLQGDVRALIAARRSNPSLQRGALVWLQTTADSLVYARVFTAENGVVEAAIIVGTKASGAVTLELEISGLGVSGQAWRDVVTNDTLEAKDGRLTLTVSKGGAVLVQG